MALTLKIADKILHILTSRLSLNAAIWLFLLYGVYYTNEQDTMHLQNTAHLLAAAGIHLIWLTLIYGNTSFLMPRLLLRKKYVPYFLYLALHATLFTALIGWYSEWLILTFPGPGKNFYFFIATPLRAGHSNNFDYYLHVFMSSVLPTLFLFSMGRLTQYFFTERKKSASLEKRQLESELLLLKSQVNPHFLFNVLNGIYSLSLKNSGKAPEMILKLSHLLRYMLYESRQDYVPLAKELEMLAAYIDIEQIRLKNKEAIHLTLPPAPVEGYVAPALLIFFIENAIKHGIESMTDHAYVKVTVSLSTDRSMLHFHCTNNYDSSIGPSHRKEHSGGIGLPNVVKRLELIYPGRHDLRISDHNQTFEVILNLKLNKHDLPDHR
jgi:two-component system LytT family sensor kinase